MQSVLAYGSLLVATVLAATVLPGTSEPIVAVMVGTGFNPWLVLFVATLGNYLGALTTYGLGRGLRLGLPRPPRFRDRLVKTAVRYYQRWGEYSLLLSWIPFLGDPLTFVAGVAKIGILRFSLWVIAGNAARYGVVVWLAANA